MVIRIHTNDSIEDLFVQSAHSLGLDLERTKFAEISSPSVPSLIFELRKSFSCISIESMRNVWKLITATCLLNGYRKAKNDLFDLLSTFPITNRQTGNQKTNFFPFFFPP